MTKFKLRCAVDKLGPLAERYVVGDNERAIAALAPAIAESGHISAGQLFDIARWKSARSAGGVKRNSDLFIAELTRTALSARDERTRVEVLTLLEGVGWPTASVILHFFHKDGYPILDVRALWSLGVANPPNYTFAFWWGFVEYTRALAAKSGLDMRQLDKALWQHSLEQQE